MAEPPGVLDGWFVLHDFRTISWDRMSGMTHSDRLAAAEQATNLQTIQERPVNGASAAYSIVGHKADLLFLHVRPTLDELLECQTSFSRTALGSLCTRPYSYFSVTELSMYEASARGGTDNLDELMQQPFVQRRLYPAIPDDKPYISFYPMNKRRGEAVNWYTEEMEERRKMMREHGGTGRKFTDRVQQMITGSTGLDDWEWGVTLWATEPIAIKQLVYTMRWDEVTAKYAEFGPFYTGKRIAAEGFADLIGGIR